MVSPPSHPPESTEGQYDLYGGVPPHQKHSDTSREAAYLAMPTCNEKQRLVFAFLEQCGVRGATDEEMQTGIPMAANTQRPRRRELELKHLIVKTLIVRQTRARRYAHVYMTRETWRRLRAAQDEPEP